jgi:D-arabinose 1-dehydrogenase-like Zn-dependent alcohol dehydrogenase
MHARNDDPMMMRAIRLDGPGLRPRIERLPVRHPTSGDQILLRVVASGVCHTDLQLLEGTLNPGVWPLTAGHEIVGQVVEGPGELVGRHAVVYYSRPCGECEWCRGGQEQVCPNAGPQPGLSADGGFAEYVVVPADSLVPLPDGLDPIQSAPLGCAAATAYHACYGVADVQPGETVVVFGVGGVGLPLIQLAKLRGARVLAVGRSASKLTLARELGAETIDASRLDPAIQVRRLTGGEGAHVVFELVASDETMPAALAMPRRRGKLVFVGYSAARLCLNPLELVLRETQLLSSLGNTRAELREVVGLAAAGVLCVPIAAEYALEDVDLALEALRAGQLAGRAVVVPARRPIARTPVGPAESVTISRENVVTVAAAPSRVARTTDDEAAPPQPAHLDGRPLEDELIAFVRRGIDAPRDDAEFKDLALRLFAYQFANNRPYRLLCERRGKTPKNVSHWRAIPPVPIAAFKETILASEPVEGAVEFNSSGTTEPERKSRHFHPDLALYDLNAMLNFKAHVLPDVNTMRFAVLFPRRDELPHSSLAHWLTLMVERFGARGSDWFVSNEAGLQTARLVRALQAADEPVGVLAASFGLVHFLEYSLEHNLTFELPGGSRVMDTGGYKGRSREYAKDELYAMVTRVLGVPTSHIVNMYGMTEHGTQFLDAVLRDTVSRRAARARYKVVPPWARTLVVDPETLTERPRGERGLLLHFDLINRASVLAVLTEDVGVAVDNGFDLLGRAQGSEARGCSIALDELIQAVRGGGER